MKASGSDRDGSYGDAGIGVVGAWLKKAREERGETLDEVASTTRIGKSYLEALEEGAAAKLPSPAYTRGFIRLYASHLGLSAEEALSLLEAAPVAPTETTPELPHLPSLATPPALPFKRGPAIIVLLILLLASGYLLLKPTHRSSVPEQSSRVVSPPSPKTVGEPAQNPVQSPPKSESGAAAEQQPSSQESQGIVLRLKAVSDGKVHITIDGSVSQDYDLVAGDLVEWKADNAIMLDLDNAASVEGELNGAKLNAFGEPGKAAHLVLKADGIHHE